VILTRQKKTNTAKNAPAWGAWVAQWGVCFSPLMLSLSNKQNLKKKKIAPT